MLLALEKNAYYRRGFRYNSLELTHGRRPAFGKPDNSKIQQVLATCVVWTVLITVFNSIVHPIHDGMEIRVIPNVWDLDVAVGCVCVVSPIGG